MIDTPDGPAFATVVEGLGSDSAEFRQIARAVARVDTLDGFMRAMNGGRSAKAGGGSAQILPPEASTGSLGSLRWPERVACRGRA